MIRVKSETPGEIMDGKAKRLVQAREYAGYGSARSAALSFGWPESSYRAHEAGTRGIGKNDADKYAQAFNISGEWLFYGRGLMITPELRRTTDEQPKRPAPNALPVTRNVTFSGRTIPVYGLVMGGSEGALLLDGRVVDQVIALPSLESVENAYAVYVTGDSMEPRYYSGEAVYVHPAKPPRKDDFVVIQIQGDDGRIGYVKQFKGYAEDEIVLWQFNPPGEIRFPREKVAEVHLIVGCSRF